MGLSYLTDAQSKPWTLGYRELLWVTTLGVYCHTSLPGELSTFRRGQLEGHAWIFQFIPGVSSLR